MRLILLAAAAGLVALPGAALAATAFGALEAKDCVGGVVPNAVARDKLFEASGLTFSAELVDDFTHNRLGTKAEDAAATCNDDTCKGAKRKLADLFEAARPLRDAEPLAPEGFKAVINPAAMPPRDDRPAAFLNGNWPWLTLRCTAAAVPVPTPVVTKPDKKKAIEQPAWVIAKTEEDAGKAFDKRAFASLGYSTDRLTDKSTYDFDVFVGYATPILTDRAQVEFQPFASLQRHSEKKVDDLAFGTAFTWFPGDNGDVLQLKGAWESDHELKSSVWRADLGWTPPLFNACERSTVPGKHFAVCELTLAADYADIQDAGEKEGLLKLKSFTRLGANLNLTFGQSMGKDLGFVVFTGGYQTRASVSGSDADADLATASIGYTPGDASHFKISIDYTNGRDLTSLEKQEKVVLTVGFRR